MSILLAAPQPVALEPENPWPGLYMTWTGWDDTVWELSEDSSGVRLLAGTRGLSTPPFDHFTDDSPAVHGSRWRGYRSLERPVFWPLGVYGGGGTQEWLDYDRAFWRTLHPKRPGTWTVRQPSGETRTLRCRFRTVDDDALDVDPSLLGWGVYGVRLCAEQPFWQGQAITRSWQAAEPVDFFGAGAPSFSIGSGSTLDDASIDNTGDEPAWPVWTLHGPFTSVEVGVDGQVVEVPFALADGQSLTIDTAPTAQRAIDSAGVERTGELGEAQFAAVPAGTQVELSITMVGTGTVQAALVPLYHRAW